jgi:hypothetical protein
MPNKDTHSKLDQAVLGISSGTILLQGQEACRHAALRLVDQAHRKLQILSYDLDAPIYDQAPFLAAVKNLAIRSRYSQIQILLQTNERVQKEGHRLIELWRRLTSVIEIRRPHPDYIDHPENFLLVDDCGYLQWDLMNRYEGSADFQAKLDTGRYADFFKEVWERSELDSDLRHLHI